MYLPNPALLREWRKLEVVRFDAEVGGDVVADHFQPVFLFGGEAALLLLLCEPGFEVER